MELDVAVSVNWLAVSIRAAPRIVSALAFVNLVVKVEIRRPGYLLVADMAGVVMCLHPKPPWPIGLGKEKPDACNALGFSVDIWLAFVFSWNRIAQRRREAALACAFLFQVSTTKRFAKVNGHRRCRRRRTERAQRAQGLVLCEMSCYASAPSGALARLEGARQ